MIAISMLLLAVTPVQEDLHLLCSPGARITDRASEESAAPAPAIEAAGSTEFILKDGKASLKPPMIAYYKGRDGWWEVRELVVTDTEIGGRIKYNMFASDRFRIDRRTGELTSTGGFSGQCRKLEKTERAF